MPAVGDLFDGTVAQEPMAGLAAPVPSEGAATYVVGTVIPVRRMEELLGDLPMVQGWSVSLFDSQGRLLARRGAVSDPADAGDDIRLTDRLELAPWTVEVRVLHELATHVRQRMAVLLAALVLGALLAAWIGGWLASQRLARSVSSLSDPPGTPQPPPEINEIRQARSLIDEAFAQRERSEAELRLREAQLSEHPGVGQRRDHRHRRAPVDRDGQHGGAALLRHAAPRDGRHDAAAVLSRAAAPGAAHGDRCHRRRPAARAATRQVPWS